MFLTRFHDSIHIGQIIVNLSDPVRLGQCKTAKITIHRSCPMQADGEPWMNQKCVIELQATRGRIMLRNKVDELVRKRLQEKAINRSRRLSSGSNVSTSTDCSSIGPRGDFNNQPFRATTPELLSQYNAIKVNPNTQSSVNSSPNFQKYRKQASNTSNASISSKYCTTPITEYEVTQFFETANNQ